MWEFFQVANRMELQDVVELRFREREDLLRSWSSAQSQFEAPFSVKI